MEMRSPRPRANFVEAGRNEASTSDQMMRIVRRPMRRAGSDSTGRQVRRVLRGLFFSPAPASESALSVTGVLAAVLGVAVASALIALVQLVVHFSNISLLYLPVVLWLAVRFGRWPAILGSVLAFLAYDFLFIPPIYRFTVNNPTEWVSLAALLATSLVIGQLTVAVQTRAREALESERRTATLYALAELIASTTEETLIPALARHVVDVFAPAGVMACGLILPDAQGRPVTRALAPGSDDPAATPLTLDAPEWRAQAAWALERGRPVGGRVPSTGKDAANAGEASICFFVPLRSREDVIGLLGVTGTAALRTLIPGSFAASSARAGAKSTAVGENEMAGAATTTPAGDALGTLFGAFCRQIALALDRATLQREAVHAAVLRESDRLKDVLLGSVTHDLRTPLASIGAAAESLLDPDIAWSEGERREFAETIVASAHRLNRLVTNLLDLSRLEAGVAVPEKRWYPIEDVIATVLDQLDLIGRTQGYTTVVDVPDDVPPVPLDHAQIEQVLTNLIENALKYSPQGSTITIRARVLVPNQENQVLEVRVADQGIGIPPHELEAIFSKFYRVQHVQLPWANGRPPAGTGLGLAISAAIIQAHDGRIWAESKPGAGATFIFTLPIPLQAPESHLPDLHISEEELATDSQSQGPSATETTASKGATA